MICALAMIPKSIPPSVYDNLFGPNSDYGKLTQTKGLSQAKTRQIAGHLPPLRECSTGLEPMLS